MSKEMDKKQISRRNFLLGLAGAGVIGIGGGAAVSKLGKSVTDLNRFATNDPGTSLQNSLLAGEAPQTLSEGTPSTLERNQDFSDLKIPAEYQDRVLVLIECFGGLDGLSCTVPYGDGAYYDARGGLAIPQNEILTINDQLGLNPNLENIFEHKDRLVVIQGVGPTSGNLSHFQMQEAWNQADPTLKENYSAGFVARLANALGSQNPDAGLLAASTYGYSSGVSNINVPFLSTRELEHLEILNNQDPTYVAFRKNLSSFQGSPKSDAIGKLYSDIYDIGKPLPSIDSASQSQLATTNWKETDNELAPQLEIAAHILRSDLGTKVIQTQISGFDLHANFAYQYPLLMKKIDTAVGAFLNDVEAMGKKDQVVVAITSEFGRRVRPIGDGIDHGSANSLLVIGGSLKAGVYGEAPSLTDLDNKGNLKTTVPFDQFLGTLGQDWLGVPTERVLAQSPETLGIV